MAEKQTARYGAVGNPRQMCLRPHGRPYERVEAVISVKPAHAPTRVIRDMMYLSLGMVTEKCKDGPQEACTLMAGNYCSIGSLDKVFCQMHVCAYFESGCLPENPKPAEDSEF